MNKPLLFYRDVLTGLFFTAGVFGFVSGEFIFSTLLFGAASLSSNLDLHRNLRA
ncbi:hypothetical protein ACQE3E_10895 [Methylomonas sp. MED-D]|uniref:hypothetical protein n=1 Tax=Methylomonas TaxID=416 RepID=UPI000ADBA1D2|nr:MULTISPECIES: hypothetical protein [Methylomonas]MDT4328567.1 hypothetical protein [Methylomonas sp. MV1]NJA06234.1 hypothetical protein [Methylococcaceae bacterium WWC4]WGS88197.1 hypothetical protein QC632_10645 [Methylomonas sp. UP202]